MENNLHPIFQNILKPFTMDIQNKKEENPLFPIARSKHFLDVQSREYEFLGENYYNSQTYILGFCRGVLHATALMEEKLKLVTDAYNKLKSQQLNETNY